MDVSSETKYMRILYLFIYFLISNRQYMVFLKILVKEGKGGHKNKGKYRYIQV